MSTRENRCTDCGRLKPHLATGFSEALIDGKRRMVARIDSGICIACRAGINLKKRLKGGKAA